MKKIFFLSLIFLSFSSLTFAQKNQTLAQTPTMGWNSWNTFATNISEELVIGIVDNIVSKGLKDAGYEYVVIDDGWMLRERDENGNLVPDPEKFPNGIKHLADYIHSKGLKFGIYNCAGTHTCAGYPGTRGHEYQDARLYASWGVDFLKYDWCSTGKLNAEEAYITMRDALAKTGRPIVLNICEWGNNDPWLWAAPVGHSWRISGDIFPCFDCEDRHDDGLPTQWSAWGVMKVLNMRDNDELRRHSGPGAWNDYDMMEVGNGMTAAEDRAHFAMWAMLASPLFLGNDLRKASQETIDIVTNKEIIAVNQDPRGVQAYRYLKNTDSLEVWVKPLQNNEWAVCFLNAGSKVCNLDYDWSTVVFNDEVSGSNINVGKTVCKIRNLYAKKDIGTTKKHTKAVIGSHDVLMVTLKPLK